MAACKEIHAFCEIVYGESCSFFRYIYILYNSHSKKLTDNNLSCLVYAWTQQRVALNAAINTPTAVKPTPDTRTFPAAASTQSSHKWMHHLTCLAHVSTTPDGVRACPLHRTKLVILPLVLYVRSRGHWFNRSRERGATRQLCMSARMSQNGKWCRSVTWKHPPSSFTPGGL